MDDTWRRRRAVSLLAVVAVVAVLALGFGHRGAHAARNVLVPGAGLYDHRHVVLGLALTLAAIISMVLWIRWGLDWLVVAVVVASMVVSAALAFDDTAAGHAAASGPARAAHEFPLVVLCLLYTSPSPRDRTRSRMPSSA